MPRMNILNAAEQKQFEMPPVFDSYQRKKFFDFPKYLLEMAHSFRKPDHQIGFLISSGYFNAVKSFFAPEDYYQSDIDYVARRLNVEHNKFDSKFYANRTRQRHENIILKFYGFKRFNRDAEATFIDERGLLWHSLVISAAERESAYVIDGLMHNDVVKSDIHSTDTHGYSEVIFATTHLLGFSYAPRIKNLKKQSLYIFKSNKSTDQSEWKITPDKYINEKIIEDNWDDILRFITTIKLKETTASDIFRRMNSYSKESDLYKALKAFGQIIKSLFILRYIDELELRQAIEKQLNPSSQLLYF